MADNVALPASGVTAATDEIGGVHHQRIKVEYGGDGTATEVTATTPLPVTMDIGTLVQRLEAVCVLLGRIAAGSAGQPGDTLGRTRVVFDSATAALATVTQVTRLHALGAAAYPAEPAAFGLTNLPVAALRDRIAVS